MKKSINKRRIHQVACATVTSLMAGGALAQSYISADLLIGSADQNLTITDFGSISGDDISYGLRAAYNLNQNIAFELAYQDYGEYEDNYIVDSGATVHDVWSSSATTAGIKGTLPLEQGFSLHGRVGVSLWDFDLRETASNQPTAFAASDDGTDPYYGIGAEFMLNPAFSVGAEYTVTDMQLTYFDGEHEVNNLALYITYRF